MPLHDEIRHPRPNKQFGQGWGMCTDDRPHTVYVLIADDDSTLYVGCSRNVERRLQDHRRRDWWQHVDHVVEIGTWCRRIALDVEWGLIQTYKPLANFVGTDEWRQDMKDRQIRYGLGHYAAARREAYAAQQAPT